MLLSLPSLFPSGIVGALYKSQEHYVKNWGIASTDFEYRGALEGSLDAGYLALVVNTTECRDQQTYKCKLGYVADKKFHQPYSTISVEVEGC